MNRQTTSSQAETPHSNPVVQKLIRLNYVTAEWVQLLPTAFSYFESTVLRQLRTTNFFPEGVNIFRAFRECSYENTKVVLIGQDPYPGTYKVNEVEFPQAIGLSFDNAHSQLKPSKSLINLVKEKIGDLGLGDHTNHPESWLGHLPSQGVLMLNTALTVEEHKAGSHTALWKPYG